MRTSHWREAGVGGGSSEMALRPRGYGLTNEVKRKINDKYDIELEEEARQWMQAVVEEPLGDSSNGPLGQQQFHLVLKDGTYLCKLMNRLKPGSVKKINNSQMAFKMMENIGNFLTAAESYGLTKADLFQTVDLYEAGNMVQVVNTIHALGRKAQKHGFLGPALGVKEADHNPRNFDEEKLNAGQTVIGLQMGTNRGASQSGMNFGKSRSIID